MGVAYYPSFEHQVAGFDPSVEVSGKPIARAIEKLDEICKRIGTKPLLSFYGESNEEAFAKIGEPVPADLRDDPIVWSNPEIGIETVESLIEYLSAHPDELPDTPRIMEDLEGFKKVLMKAREHRTRFRLRIDV